jgi:hypothetical protein
VIQVRALSALGPIALSYAGDWIRGGYDRARPANRRLPLSARIARAALWPGAPVTPPPGCVPEPHMYRPGSGAR